MTKNPRYPELDKIAQHMANEICVNINHDAVNADTDMPYAAQYILEKVIKILEKRV